MHGGNGTAVCGSKGSATGHSVVTGAPNNLAAYPFVGVYTDFVLGYAAPP